MGIKSRKEREKEQKRRLILNAAKKLFSEKGFSKATMEEIAKEAEFSPGTLYLYFKNKDELDASLSVEILEFLSDKLHEVVENQELDPLQKLYALKEKVFEVYNYDPDLLVSLFHLKTRKTFQHLTRKLVERIDTLSRDALKTLAKIFDEGINKGVFIEKHPNELADIFWSIYSGVVLWEDSKKFLNEDKNFIMETLETAIDIFIKGVLK
ncbi:MAG: TetR/AcrR family transcriptional regulator [Desulfobacterales bacterium]|nr:TetR/AcrR family transcriptional regulator [Desulfobacterales bacterium]MCP4159004.1 TetR/AcrR family transcriptional regulator [Deltaproteobacteria bacterium]